MVGLDHVKLIVSVIFSGDDNSPLNFRLNFSSFLVFSYDSQLSKGHREKAAPKRKASFGYK